MKTPEKEHNLIEQMLLNINNPDSYSQPVKPNQNSDFLSQYPTIAFQIREFIDEIPGGFFIYRADGDEEIIYANEALLRIFGCDTLAEFRELTGNSFKGVVHPDDLETVERSIQEQIHRSREDLDYVEYRIVQKNGTVRWVEDYGHFVQSESVGNIFYVFVSDATDKIKRRLTEKAALLDEKRENEQKLQNLIEEYDKERKLVRQEHLQRLEVIEGLSINYESILYADLDTDKVLPYRLSTRLERQFERKLQTRPFGWFVEDYVNVWVHPEDRPLVAEMTAPAYIRQKLAENSTFYINYRCLQNNETKYLQLRFVNVGRGDRISQIVMGYRSIDEEVLQEMKQKKLLEIALENAKQASVAKSTFLSHMSHDMRTPLNAIFGYTALARKNPEDGRLVRSYLNKIETAGGQILDLIEKVLELSYLESGSFRVTETPCSLRETVQNVYNHMLPKADAKNIRLCIDTDSLRHDAVFADPDKLQQILLHLIENAVQYTPNEGEVTIGIAEETKKTTNDMAVFRFAVRDNGIGIANESLERIFKPFEREKDTTASGVYGSGLGLTIAKHIIENMGGAITAESCVGKGSVFTVTLTLRLQDHPCACAKQNKTDMRGLKVLLVEDNEINMEIETELLEDLGFTVEPAENGQIALNKVSACTPASLYDLILMDIQMPVMDGREAAKAIRKLETPALAHIPILALSANAFESDKRLSMEAGIDAHLTKPIDIALLCETVTKILQAHKTTDRKSRQ